MPKISSVKDIRPKIKIGKFKHIADWAGKLYNTATLYNKDQYYYGGKSSGIVPALLITKDLRPAIVKVTDGDVTYYLIPEAGMPIGLLLTLTYPARVVKT